MGNTMQRIVLKAYARGNPKASDFELQEVDIPQAGEREILVKTLWLALDPLCRFAIDEVRLSGATHLALGDVMYGATVSEVIESNHPDYAVGDIVEDRSGWCEYAVLTPDDCDYRGPPRIIDAALAPVSTALGVLGMPGQTAYSAMVDIAKVQAGETVVISAAAGAVGTIAGQIAKILGARVVGIAGGPDKCQRLLELGFDAAADYKADNFSEQLALALPEGAEVYLDNVGGEVTLAVLPLLKRGARMPMCGFIAYYGVGEEGPGPDRLPGFYRQIMAKGLEIKGFAGFMGGQRALDQLAQWIDQGKLRYPETIVEGLQAAPEAFAKVFESNAFVGKLLVKVAG